MSQDRIVFSFVLGWFVLIAVLIALDWVANPNRGAFRPKGQRPPLDPLAKREERQRHRRDDDSSIRATLRDAYGASSLRLTWTHDQEDEVRRLDDSHIAVNPDDLVDAVAHEIEPAPISRPEREPELGPEKIEAVAAAPILWRPGADPLLPTPKGTRPAASTIRSRVWKNHGEDDHWDGENLRRLRAGKPPRRERSATNRLEYAIVDVETGLASWGTDPQYPFDLES